MLTHLKVQRNYMERGFHTGGDCFFLCKALLTRLKFSQCTPQTVIRFGNSYLLQISDFIVSSSNRWLHFDIATIVCDLSVSINTSIFPSVFNAHIHPINRHSLCYSKREHMFHVLNVLSQHPGGRTRRRKQRHMGEGAKTSNRQIYTYFFGPQATPLQADPSRSHRRVQP